jgi:hypothetical protein
MLTPINLGALRISEEVGDLYDVLKRTTGFITGTCDVDISSLPISPEARFRLAQWSLLVNAAVAEHEQQRIRATAAPPQSVAPAPRVVQPVAVAVQPAVVTHEEPECIREALDVSKNEERRRVEQQARDEDAFEVRLREYERAGLEPTSENAGKIVAFIKDHPQLKGYYSAQAADVAVAWLGPKGSNVLTWKAKTAPAPPPAPEPTEVLQDWQLPLDADERKMKNASVPALQDLLKRRRAATNQQYVRRGSFSSSF